MSLWGLVASWGETTTKVIIGKHVLSHHCAIVFIMQRAITHFGVICIIGIALYTDATESEMLDHPRQDFLIPLPFFTLCAEHLDILTLDFSCRLAALKPLY